MKTSNTFRYKAYEQWLHERLIISTRHFLYDIAVVEQRHERWETADEVTAIVLITNGHENDSKHSSDFPYSRFYYECLILLAY